MTSAKFNEPITPQVARDNLHRLLSAPLFIYRDGCVEGSKVTENDYLPLVPLLAKGKGFPFPECRILAPGWFRIWIADTKGGALVMFAKDKSPTPISGFVTDFTDLSLQKEFLGVKFNKGPQAEKLVGIVFSVVVRFVIDSMASGNFIAEVTPTPRSDKPNHVKWAQSQKHYVIIHRKDRMNSVGAVPSPDGKKTTEIRMAHTRRAHMRILRSARFKEKQGQRVFVKSCWVGPAEWKINNSIYKILP